ncbi:hypothetical protein Y032_0131g1642 [Ancylostoma ceylanicum]|uniref:Uncharacterized protein n=1 Tax=Ancylostoma ceylanicum TaxID=53326 RepID=A0A016T746_9BILA|nr:hypothetical protein Y032_0131g1642 [Ancylostoma ceylanicum]
MGIIRHRRVHGVEVEAVEDGEEEVVVVEAGEDKVVRIVVNKEAGEDLKEEIREEDRGADHKEVRVAGEATAVKVVGEVLTEEIEAHGADRKEVKVAGEATEVKEEEVNGAVQEETVGVETEDQREAEGQEEDVGMVAVETGEAIAGVEIAGAAIAGAAIVGEAAAGAAGKDQEDDITVGELNHGGLASANLHNQLICDCSADRDFKRQFITVIINIVQHTGINIYKESHITAMK